MYYDEDVLYAIASAIGKLVKIDVNTCLATRRRFALVCVEIDLTKPLVAKFWLNSQWHAVEYEGLHIVCFGCRRDGHQTEQCSFSSKLPTTMETIANIDAGRHNEEPQQRPEYNNNTNG